MPYNLSENNYRGDLNTRQVRIPWCCHSNIKCTGFQMPFECQTAQPFANWTNGGHFVCSVFKWLGLKLNFIWWIRDIYLSIWKPTIWKLTIWKTDNWFKMTAILVGFQIVGTKAIARPLENWKPVFSWRHLWMFPKMSYLKVMNFDPLSTWISETIPWWSPVSSPRKLKGKNLLSALETWQIKMTEML